jgi:hypothetical protein
VKIYRVGPISAADAARAQEYLIRDDIRRAGLTEHEKEAEYASEKAFREALKAYEPTL